MINCNGKIVEKRGGEPLENKGALDRGDHWHSSFNNEYSLGHEKIHKMDFSFAEKFTTTVTWQLQSSSWCCSIPIRMRYCAVSKPRTQYNTPET